MATSNTSNQSIRSQTNETYKIAMGIHPEQVARDDISVNGKKLQATTPFTFF